MAAPQWLADIQKALLARGVPKGDVLLTALAAVDVVALAIRRDLADVPIVDRAAPWILWFDRAVVVVFAVEWIFEVARSRSRAGYVKATWYDLVGMIPLPVALFRIFLLFRIPHTFLVGNRDPGRAKEVGGADYFLTVFRRYEPVLVEEITDPVLVRLLQVVREALGRGRYLNAVGESLEARRDRIHASILRGLRESGALRMALSVPPAEAAVRALADELTTVVVGTLTDPDLDAVVKESIDDALAGLQRRISEKDHGEAAAAP